MERRDNNPGFTTVRLFRQNHPGDSDGVVERMRTELTQSK
jgi:hypothetical protein